MIKGSIRRISNFSILLGVGICAYLPIMSAFAVEPVLPAVIIEQDLVLPVIPIGNGSELPVCIDDVSGLLVFGCDGFTGPVGPQGPQGDAGLPDNLALKGQECLPDNFISGFDLDGNIICVSE